MNALSLMEILVYVVRSGDNSDEMLNFLDKSEQKVKSSSEALALLKITKGEIYLVRKKELDPCKVMYLFLTL